MEGATANGLLSLVVVNTLVLFVFAFSFAKPRSRDWHSLGVFSAFLLALFTEMYGFPLTIYFLGGWLANRYPEADPFAYSAGQVWHILFGFRNDLQFNPVAVFSYILIAGGFILIAYAWRVLYEAQRNHRLAQFGPYSRIRHPQYVGFVLVMLGLLLVWPALSTLIMLPVLVVIYIRLARREEQDALGEFGEEYRRYMASTSAFFPRFDRDRRKVGNKL